MKQKKVLVLGATGAMGKYLVPKLAASGYAVDAVALDEYDFGCKVNLIKAQAKDFEFRTELLKNKYDGIVDFLTYPTHELVLYLPELLESTDHYIYLSSYRVYNDTEVPVKETSPRLLDNSPDVMLRNSDDYSIYKARGEDILKSWKRKNWTVVRPAITYSLMRYQLVTLEGTTTVGRAKLGKTVVLPETAKNVNGTMSWAGDVAEMIARLLFNEKAFGEIFTASTAEYHTWGEIADYYKDICNLNAVWVDQTDFLKIAGTKGTIKFTPLERFDGKSVEIELTLAEDSGSFPKGVHVLKFPPQLNRYDIQMQELADMIRNNGSSSYSFEHDYIVHEAVLAASGYIKWN